MSFLLLLQYKGRVMVPKGKNCWKSSKGGSFSIQNYIVDIWTFIQGFKQGFSEKLQYDFLKMRGGGGAACHERGKLA